MGFREEQIALLDKFFPATAPPVNPPGPRATNGAEALANVRAFRSPISGTPQWTDDAGREHSDRAWTVAMNDERRESFADQALLEILARADLLTDFKWRALATWTADQWVENELKKGLPSG